MSERLLDPTTNEQDRAELNKRHAEGQRRVNSGELRAYKVDESTGDLFIRPRADSMWRKA